MRRRETWFPWNWVRDRAERKLVAGIRMRRREFIGLLGGVAAALPLAARAQQGGLPRRVGVLLARAESDPVFQARFQAFRTRLQQLGWTDGDNLRIDYRWTAGIADRFL